MAKLSIEVHTSWVETEGQLRNCNCCDDMIFLNAYVLIFYIGGKKKETEVIICESCKDLI